MDRGRGSRDFYATTVDVEAVISTLIDSYVINYESFYEKINLHILQRSLDLNEEEALASRNCKVSYFLIIDPCANAFPFKLIFQSQNHDFILIQENSQIALMVMVMKVDSDTIEEVMNYNITSITFDRNVHHYRSLEDKNISTNTIILLLVLSSIIIFTLTVAVMYLLFHRNLPDSDCRTSDSANNVADGRLGIDHGGRHLAGSTWIELKSTSSGSSPSESSDMNGRLPKEVGRSGSSVCDSIVSELSAYTTVTKDWRLFAPKLDLEKIDEEGQYAASLSQQGMDSSFHTANARSICSF